MFSLNSKYGEVKVFAETIEEEAIGQVIQMTNSPLGENAQARIMPDCLTENAEVLTEQGWRYITSLSLEDKIANYFPEDASVSFLRPKAIIIREKRQDEKIFVFENLNKGIRCCVSENHRMALKNNMGVLAKDIEQFKVSDMLFSGEHIINDGIPFSDIQRKEIEYDGKLVCVECDSSFFICRQDGCVFVTGNCHAGAGCVIGTTMHVTDKVCPNVIGVDISCGVDLVCTDINFENRLEELDEVVRKVVPAGFETHQDRIVCEATERMQEMKCWPYLKKDVQEKAWHSVGTLGSGNHFLEVYNDGKMAVHSGSRNIGLNVANYYQKLAIKRFEEKRNIDYKALIDTIPPREREAFIKARKEDNPSVPEALMWLEGNDMLDYLYDSAIMNIYAIANRKAMLRNVVDAMGGKILTTITSTHNYIADDKILRKGAIQAYDGQLLVIPLNMRDGLLVCKGKGNPDWNYSAPHGAGRLYSRSKAKQNFSVEEYAETMKDIYTTCVNASTLDEAPFVYKDMNEIMHAIEPTVTIIERLIPIYNFKAGGD